MTTTTMAPELTLFGGGTDPTVMNEATFDLDQCRDIATHGMAQGVAGFIYNHNLYEWFNENSDEIEKFLNQLVSDSHTTDEYKNYIHYLSETQDIDDHLALKAAAVWFYVESKCYNFVVEHDPNF